MLAHASESKYICAASLLLDVPMEHRENRFFAVLSSTMCVCVFFFAPERPEPEVRQRQQEFRDYIQYIYTQVVLCGYACTPLTPIKFKDLLSLVQIPHDEFSVLSLMSDAGIMR